MYRDMYGNAVTQLPTGVFAGMTALQQLYADFSNKALAHYGDAGKFRTMRLRMCRRMRYLDSQR